MRHGPVVLRGPASAKGTRPRRDGHEEPGPGTGLPARRREAARRSEVEAGPLASRGAGTGHRARSVPERPRDGRGLRSVRSRPPSVSSALRFERGPQPGRRPRPTGRRQRPPPARPTRPRRRARRRPSGWRCRIALARDRGIGRCRSRTRGSVAPGAGAMAGTHHAGGVRRGDPQARGLTQGWTSAPFSRAARRPRVHGAAARARRSPRRPRHRVDPGPRRGRSAGTRGCTSPASARGSIH